MKRIGIAILCVLLVTVLLLVPVLAAGAADLSFRETPLLEALNVLAREAQVNIIVANDVTGTASLEVTGYDVERALNTLLVNTPYEWVLQDNVYLVGHRDSALFSAVAETAIYRIQYVPVMNVVDRLQDFPVQVAVDQEQALLSVTAPPAVLDDVTTLVKQMDSVENLRQVRYTLAVVELTGGTASAIGLKRASLELPAPTELVLTVLADPSVLSLVSAVGLASLQLEAHDERRQEGRVSRPEIVTALGHTSTLRVLQQELQTLTGTNQLSETTRGLEITLTPKHVNSDAREVLTHLVMASPGLAQLDTELWLGADEQKLVAVIEQQMEYGASETLSQRLGKERRYFAVYASAQLLGTAPEQPQAIASGSLGRLDELLWPSVLPDAVLEENYLALQVSRGQSWNAKIDGGVWLADRVRMETSIRLGSETAHLWAGVEGRIAREDTRIGTRIHYGHDEGLRVSMGLSDRLQVNENVTLVAGVHPIVFGLQERALERPYWWVEAAVREERVGGRVRLNNTGAGVQWHVGLDVAITQNLDATISYSDTFGTADGRFWVGLTMRF